METAPKSDNRMMVIALVIGGGIVLVCLVFVCVIAILMLLGPSTGTVFSEIGPTNEFLATPQP